MRNPQCCCTCVIAAVQWTVVVYALEQGQWHLMSNATMIVDKTNEDAVILAGLARVLWKSRRMCERESGMRGGWHRLILV
jgi:hypothetical protein